MIRNMEEELFDGDIHLNHECSSRRRWKTSAETLD